MSRILIVDDETNISMMLEEILKNKGHGVECADSGELALALLRKSVFDIVITDLRMEGMSGLELLTKCREYFPSVTVVLMTAFASVDNAVAAMRNGAYDYLVKPFTPEQLEHLMDRVEEFRRLKEENTKLKTQVDTLSEPSAILTRNMKMHKVLETAKKVGVTDSTVLITG